MNKNKYLGKEGEKKAKEYLQLQQFEIIDCNYRYKRNEIDIIAKKKGVLIFIEVKTRSNDDYGLPEEAVNEQKLEGMQKVAEHYIHSINWHGPIRFDIISIITSPDFELTHFEDIQ